MYAKVDPATGAMVLRDAQTYEFALLGNFLASRGEAGRVLRVSAKDRTGAENFVTQMRRVLATHYAGKTLGIGGTFLIRTGRAKLHVMPDFSDTPITTDEGVQAWLNFYECRSPLVCVGTFASSDPGLDLRIEHYHCKSGHGEGGHYHYDTTPPDVHYEGYFVLAESIHRVDPPTQTHKVGRD